LTEQATVEQQVSARATPPIPSTEHAPTQKSHKAKGAPARIAELLAEVKSLKAERDGLVRSHGTELEKLRGELLNVLAENSEMKSREEQRMWQADEDTKARTKAADDHRLLCLRALVDVAHQTGAYTRHPDFDTKMRRAETQFSTQLLEQILMFSPRIAPELAYALAGDPKAAARVSALPIVAGCFMLSKIAGPFEDALKLQKLIGG